MLYIRELTTKLALANERLQGETERRIQLEKALRESETKFKTVVEQLPNTVVYLAALDERSTTLYVSPQIEQVLGYTPEEYRDDPDIWASCLHPDDSARVLAEVSRCHKTGEQFVSDYRMIGRDGKVIWVHDEATIIRDNAGNPLHLLGINLDITDRHKTLEKLRFSEEKFATAFRASPGAITLSSLETSRFVDVNESFAAMTGFSRHELIGKSALELGLWAQPEQRRQLIRKMLDRVGVRNYEMTMRRKSGELAIRKELLGELMPYLSMRLSGKLKCQFILTGSVKRQCYNSLKPFKRRLI